MYYPISEVIKIWFRLTDKEKYSLSQSAGCISVCDDHKAYEIFDCL